MHQVRLELAKAELRLRQPRTTAAPGHLILATRLGESALEARKLGDASLLAALQKASTSDALMGSAPFVACRRQDRSTFI